MNFYGPESRGEHTIAGRIIPLFEALMLSIGRATNQPLPEQKHCKELPIWTHNVCDQLAKTIFKKLVDGAPVILGGQVNARRLGQFVGVLLRGAAFVFKDAPAHLKQDGLLDLSPEQEEKVNKAAGLELLYPVASEKFGTQITNEDELFQTVGNGFQAKAENLMSHWMVMAQYLCNRPASEQYEFLSGIPEGFKMVINAEGDFAAKSKRYELYLLLLMCWPEIAEMQKAQPPKTRRDLLEWLEKQEGRGLVEDPKQFYELCDDVGLDLAPPGHPQKATSK